MPVCSGGCVHECVKRQWCFIGRRLWGHRIPCCEFMLWGHRIHAWSDEVLGPRVSHPEVEIRTQEARRVRKSHAGSRKSRL